MPKTSLPKSSSRLRLYLTAYLPAIIWAIIIYLISAQKVLPGVGIDVADFLSKKMGHVVVYAILWWLVHRAVRKTHPHQPKLALWLPFLIVFIYAVSDELHQSFVPGRTSRPRDIGYDMIGAGIAWLKRYDYI